MNRKLTTAEAAEKLGVSTARVRRLVLDGRLPAEKFGRDLSFHEADVKAFKKLKGGRPPKPKAGTASGTDSKVSVKGSKKGSKK
jgi:excisionase family DNA binding protein